MAAGIGAFQFLVAYVVEPRLIGKSLNLSPLVVILSLVLWWALWGVPGMFLCVPLMVSLMILCAQFPQTRRVAILMSRSGRVAELGERPGPSPSRGLVGGCCWSGRDRAGAGLSFDHEQICVEHQPKNRTEPIAGSLRGFVSCSGCSSGRCKSAASNMCRRRAAVWLSHGIPTA